MSHTARTTAFAASSTTARRSFFALAVVVSVGLLSGIGHLADRQYDSVLMAQSHQAPDQAATRVVQVRGAARPAA